MQKNKTLCSLFLAAASLGALVASSGASASVSCTLTNFTIDAYDHGGTYLHDTLGGVAVSFIDICGTTSGVEDCTSKGTVRRLAVALSAFSLGKNLLVGYSTLNACSDFTPYTRATDLLLAN